MTPETTPHGNEKPQTGVTPEVPALDVGLPSRTAFPVRSFEDEVVSRIEAIQAKHSSLVQAEVLGTLSYPAGNYPLYRLTIERPSPEEKLNIMLSGGVHGDEPAGVQAVLEFLEKHCEK